MVIISLLMGAMPMEAQRKASKKKQKPINTLHYVGPYAGGAYSLLFHSIPETQLYGGGAGMVGAQYFLRTPKKRFTFSASLEAMYFTSITGGNDFTLTGQYFYNDPWNQDLIMDYQLDFSDYKELHRQLSLNLPILFGKEFKRSYFGVGTNIRANIMSGYNTSALLTTSAVDPEIIGSLQNMPTHNFTKFPQKSKGDISLGLDVMAMAEVGLILDEWMPQSSIEYASKDMTQKSISYRLGLFAACGVLSINNNQHNQQLINVNNITDLQHNSLLAADRSIDNAVNSLVVGAKFSVLFQLNKAKYRTKKPKKKTTPTPKKTQTPVVEEVVEDTIPAEVFYIGEKTVEKNDVLILENLFFDHDKTTIKNASTQSMEELYQALVDNPEMNILSIGHTDNVGTDTYNQKLSEGRAKSVRNEMVRRGIDPDRIEWKGMGESQPITTNDTEEGRATNRRVEIKIL